MYTKKEFPEEFELAEKILDGIDVMYEGYNIDVIEYRIKSLRRGKTKAIIKVESIGEYKYNIYSKGFEKQKPVKIRFNRNSGMLEKFAVLIIRSGLNHSFIANEIGMNVSTFRFALYNNSFKIREVEGISKFLKEFASKCIEASVMDVSLEEFKECEGGEFKKEEELSDAERKKFERFAERLGYMKVGKGKEFELMDKEEFGGTGKEDGFSSTIIPDALEEQDGGTEIRRKPFNLDDL